MEDLKDICLNCGKEHDPVLWGAKCDCEKPNVVHQQKCNSIDCDNVIGYIVDDDYVGLGKLYCSKCLRTMPISSKIENLRTKDDGTFQLSDGSIEDNQELNDSIRKIGEHSSVAEELLMGADVDYMIHFRNIVNEGIERYILCYNYKDEMMIYNRVLNKFVPYKSSDKVFCLFRKEITEEKLSEFVKLAEESDLNYITVHEYVQYEVGGNPVVRFKFIKNLQDLNFLDEELNIINKNKLEEYTKYVSYIY